ncbi:ribokinase [Corynebacterium lizhenjunii]|uniref:Ribokinase n=1 Tax=Corynebacterium lizhenjunii TaxID=2709394 RepID=A0A7T0PAA1_9CORY|nr:ribokinase [Corynebacterium lizhenjunii]QPK79663.1 ribokinase [Corynebacterium lizhenjunii]
MSSASLCVVGSINADLMVSVARHPQPGETVLGSGGAVLAGGKGANQAVAAALQGAHVTFVGAVGDDAYAAAALEHLKATGVDLQAVARRADTSTGLAVITVAADGENSIVVVPGANAAVDAEYVSSQAATIEAADIVLLQGEIPADGFRRAVEIARAAGARVVVNLAPVIPVDRTALLAADPLLANEHEAGLILEQLGHPPDPEATPQQLAQALLDAGCASVLLTLGAQGAVLADAAGLTPIPTRVAAVDTTGAGDAFAGAFVASLLAEPFTDPFAEAEQEPGDGPPLAGPAVHHRDRHRDGADMVAAAHHAARVAAYATLSPGAQPSYPRAGDELPELED